jgi:ribose 5-phosphate isomerase A
MNPSATLDQKIHAKRLVAEALADRVQPNSLLAVGTGTTVREVIKVLGERGRAGSLSGITAIVTSEDSNRLCTEVGIPVLTQPNRLIGLAFDGADEVDPEGRLIKGGGGAMVREKIVVELALAHGAPFIVVADESKLVGELGERWSVPIELRADAVSLVELVLREQFRATMTARTAPGFVGALRGESGLIYDVKFPKIDAELVAELATREIPGLIGHGIFWNHASTVLVAMQNGTVREIAGPRARK